jgi:cytochrome oxidase Cu insertion factor (SCO1/SenC/PrrC family)
MKVGPRAKLVLVMALFAAPIAASFLAYRYAHKVPTANHGELLLPPAQVGAAALERTGGGTFSFADVRGRWVLVAADSGGCGEACLAKLYLMRQVRLAMGRNAERLARVFIVDDGRDPDPAALAPYAGMDVVRQPRSGAVAPGLGDRGHVYLVDPHGNVMMRWSAAADPKGIIRDLELLLRASQIG